MKEIEINMEDYDTFELIQEDEKVLLVLSNEEKSIKISFPKKAWEKISRYIICMFLGVGDHIESEVKLLLKSE